MYILVPELVKRISEGSSGIGSKLIQIVYTSGKHGWMAFQDWVFQFSDHQDKTSGVPILGSHMFSW